MTDELRRAQQHFANADYGACVSACRGVLQELGQRLYQMKSWDGPALSRIAKDRDAMTKGEREAAIYAAVRHYTHQAHHTAGEGGSARYERSEAKLILTLTAALVARVQET